MAKRRRRQVRWFAPCHLAVGSRHMQRRRAVPRIAGLVMAFITPLTLAGASINRARHAIARDAHRPAAASAARHTAAAAVQRKGGAHDERLQGAGGRGADPAGGQREHEAGPDAAACRAQAALPDTADCGRRRARDTTTLPPAHDQSIKPNRHRWQCYLQCLSCTMLRHPRKLDGLHSKISRSTPCSADRVVK